MALISYGSVIICIELAVLHCLQDFGSHELFPSSESDCSESENEGSSAYSDGEEEEVTSAWMRGSRGFKVDVLLEMAADSVEAIQQQIKKVNWE